MRQENSKIKEIREQINMEIHKMLLKGELSYEAIGKRVGRSTQFVYQYARSHKLRKSDRLRWKELDKLPEGIDEYF
jgi:hypothetical protein